MFARVARRCPSSLLAVPLAVPLALPLVGCGDDSVDPDVIGDESATGSDTTTDMDESTGSTDSDSDASDTSETGECTVDADCGHLDDVPSCLRGACVAGACEAVAADDGTPCPDGDACNGEELCASARCTPAAPLSCDDGQWCNGAESCDPARGCVDGTPPELTDGVDCTVDACDEATDSITHTPSDALCGDGVCTTGTCDAIEGCALVDNPYVVCATGENDPAFVFTDIEQTYFLSNNLGNLVWQAVSDRILGGHYQQDGYWSFPAETDGYPEFPDNDVSQRYSRMVHVPGTDIVVHGNDQIAPWVVEIRVANVDPDTGVVSGSNSAIFSDNFTGKCNLFSNDTTRFMCFDGQAIRIYDTTPGSPILNFVESIPLSQPLPEPCAQACFGGTFAWDGTYFYFPFDGNSSAERRYVVYDAAGTFLDAFDPGGAGAINGTYFDWSVGRYSTHDGFGNRFGGATYTHAGGDTDDSHCFGPTSPVHE